MSIERIQELKDIIMNFRVTDLTQLLAACNQSRFGRKSVLQERALDLLKKENLTQKVQFKIYELNMIQNVLQKSRSTSSRTNQISELPLLQDSSSSECTITEPEMPQGIHCPNSKSHLSDYYSMPKFDIGIMNRNQNSSKLGSLNSTSLSATNVQFKPIPFDDVIYTLIEPKLLPQINKQRFNNFECFFKLKPEEANEISMAREFKNMKFEFDSQIHLRFCLADIFSAQDDQLPSNLTVKLNSKNIPLPALVPNNKPNMEAKRQSKPVDLTPYCKLSPISNNHLNISWTQDVNQKNYCFTIYLAKKLTSKDLLDKLQAKGIMDSSVTERLIISKLTDTDNEISTTSLKGNLNCPLGKMRLRIPVRSNQCSHIQCFDAELYLQMNEKKPSWICPICDKRAEYKTLFIDGLFTHILKEAPIDSNEIEFTDDGGWKVVQNLNKTITLTPQRRKIEEETSSIKKSKTEEEEEVIELSSDSDDDNNENLQTPLYMPKMTTFGDNNTAKSMNLNGINSFTNQFSSLNQLCNQIPSPPPLGMDHARGQARNLITRYFEKVDRQKANLEKTTHGSNFGNFNSHNLTGNFGINSNGVENNRGRNSEPNVISID